MPEAARNVSRHGPKSQTKPAFDEVTRQRCRHDLRLRLSLSLSRPFTRGADERSAIKNDIAALNNRMPPASTVSYFGEREDAITPLRRYMLYQRAVRVEAAVDVTDTA